MELWGQQAGGGASISGPVELPASSGAMFFCSCQDVSYFLRRVAEVARGLAREEGVWTLRHRAGSDAPLLAPAFPPGCPGQVLHLHDSVSPSVASSSEAATCPVVPAPHSWAGRRWGPGSSCWQSESQAPPGAGAPRRSASSAASVAMTIHRPTPGSAWPLVAWGMLAPAGMARFSEGPLGPVPWDPMLVFHAL